MENLTPEIMKLIKVRIAQMDIQEFVDIMDKLTKKNEQLAILMQQEKDALTKAITTMESSCYIQGWRDCYKFFGIEDMMEK